MLKITRLLLSGVVIEIRSPWSKTCQRLAFQEFLISFSDVTAVGSDPQASSQFPTSLLHSCTNQAPPSDTAPAQSRPGPTEPLSTSTWSREPAERAGQGVGTSLPQGPGYANP